MPSDHPDVPERGWYGDPADPTRLRWWDGTNWTNRFQAAPSGLGISHRPNAGSYRIAIPLGVGVGVLLLGVVEQRSSQSAAFVFGQTLAWGFASGLLTGVLAHASTFRWRWWFYPPVVLSIGFMSVGLMSLKESPTSIDRPTSPIETAAPTRVELAAPTRIGSLLQVDPEQIEPARVRAERTAKLQLGAVESVVMGQYAEPGHSPSVAFVGINAVRDGGLYDEMDESSANTVLNYLAGAGIDDRQSVEPGPLGGAMMCANVTQESVQGYVCAWSTVGVLGAVTFGDAVAGIDQAAQMAREFRELAEHVS